VTAAVSEVRSVEIISVLFGAHSSLHIRRFNSRAALSVIVYVRVDHRLDWKTQSITIRRLNKSGKSDHSLKVGHPL